MKMSEPRPSSITSSWVDLSHEVSSGAYSLPPAATTSHEYNSSAAGVFSPISPCRTTPVPFGSDTDYMRMLKEAQKETSCRSSARVSPITSTLASQRSSPCPSPKSPPNSPRTETADFTTEYQGVFINRIKETDTLTDFMWDWSSSPCPPKDWKATTSHGPAKGTPKPAARGRSSLSSFYTFLLTNIMSLLLGAGLGAWVYRRSTFQRVAL